jgi:predicted ATPase
MRVITKYYATLVFVIDDLQWADTSSLDLLEALIADHENLKLMQVSLKRSGRSTYIGSFPQNRGREKLQQQSVAHSSSHRLCFLNNTWKA